MSAQQVSVHSIREHTLLLIIRRILKRERCFDGRQEKPDDEGAGGGGRGADVCGGVPLCEGAHAAEDQRPFVPQDDGTAQRVDTYLYEAQFMPGGEEFYIRKTENTD